MDSVFVELVGAGIHAPFDCQLCGGHCEGPIVCEVLEGWYKGFAICTPCLMERDFNAKLRAQAREAVRAGNLAKALRLYQLVGRLVVPSHEEFIHASEQLAEFHALAASITAVP